MTDLVELAARCEKATGSDSELDEAIMAALFTREQRHIGCQEEQDDGSWSPVKDSVWVDPKTDRWVGTGARQFTSSIDDAMTLAPEGLRILSMFGPDVSLVTLHTEPFGAIGAWHQTVKAATPALALCAAALRARSSAAVSGAPKP